MSYAKKFSMSHAYWEATLSKIDGDIAEKVTNWVRNPEYILFLRGCPGCGKTYLMAAILNEMWGLQQLQHKTVLYYYEKRMLSEIRSKINTYVDYMSHVEYIANADFLMIDDFGSSKDSEFTIEVWEEIADERLGSGKIKPTIISSNLTNEEVVTRFGERTASRMFCTLNTQINFRNHDKRQECWRIK